MGIQINKRKQMGCKGSSEVDYPPTGLHKDVKKLPQWIQLGCGDGEYICAEKGANFSAENMPAEMPDLSEHKSFLTDVLSQKPELYAKYKDMKTALGVNLGHCIKTGMDNKGGVFDISNADRLGHSEVTLVNMFIHGVANIIRWETMLEEGKDIEAEVAGAKAGEECKGEE